MLDSTPNGRGSLAGWRYRADRRRTGPGSDWNEDTLGLPRDFGHVGEERVRDVEPAGEDRGRESSRERCDKTSIRPAPRHPGRSNPWANWTAPGHIDMRGLVRAPKVQRSWRLLPAAARKTITPLESVGERTVTAPERSPRLSSRKPPGTSVRDRHQ